MMASLLQENKKYLELNKINYICTMKTMKVIKEIKRRKIPIVRIDKSLNKYDDIVLFPDKLEKANDMLRRVGLPTQWTKQHPPLTT